ncbi:hypothetical protein REMIM1_PC00163 (plasmid) [Rhizobium etli bv. mimosae str. Mim1]|nr:hypothetical protein REMIM1_PC00163 [Rhizobium etli bv. mimosae str. Mim1]
MAKSRNTTVSLVIIGNPMSVEFDFYLAIRFAQEAPTAGIPRTLLSYLRTKELRVRD